MKRRNLLYIAYLIICLFPLLVVLCSRGTVSVADVFGSLPSLSSINTLFAYLGITSPYIGYISNYLTYLLLCCFAKTAYYALTFILDCADKFLRRDL